MTIDRQRRAFLTIGQVKENNTDINLPWLKSKEHFLDKCTQCQVCIESCPESIIEKGQGGYPTVNFSLGECTYCNECSTQCPEELFDTKQEQPWALKLIINDSCFPRRGIVCQSCRDACEPQAITFKYGISSIPNPELDVSQCIDCGACVSSCPANAISLISDTENTDRNHRKENKDE
jgi:ferredoxin-type protein NapF